MSLKRVERLNEGPFDFIRGAAGEVGRKVSNSAPVRAARDVVNAGKAASAAAELEKEILALAKLLGPVSQPAQPERVEPTTSAPTQSQQPKQQAQPRQRPSQTTQQRSPSTQTSQQPSPFRTTSKPKGKIGPLGKDDFRWTFDSYMRATYGEPLTEGAMDFIRGAGSAAMGKFDDFVSKYAERPSVLRDIYHAGTQASQRANAAKQQQADAKRQQQAQAAAAQLKQKIQQMGPAGIQAAKAALAKLPADVRQNVVQALGVSK